MDLYLQGIKTAYNKVYTSCGFQSNLQVPGSLAKAVTVDNEVATNSRTLHTLNVRCKVCSERSSIARWGFDAVSKMEEGPPLALYRRSQQTAPRCFLGDWAVLNGRGKSPLKGLGRNRKDERKWTFVKMSRTRTTSRNYRFLAIGGMNVACFLIAGYMAGGIEKAWVLFRLIYGTEEVLQMMTRERHKWYQPTRPKTDALQDGRLLRSSDEAPVMGVERRG